jgi:hypothetical protein
MSISEVTQVIIACVSVITLILTVSNSWEIKLVHRTTNSMKDELVKEVRSAAFAAGQKDQLDKN